MSAPDPTSASLFGSGTPAALGPDSRRGVPDEGAAVRAANDACAAAKVSGPRAECFRALVLLWNDHHESAHALVQDLPGADAAFVHGIIHRREPDFSNAQYWFHRVGRHAAFSAVAAGAGRVLASEAALLERLTSGGRWNAMAFIDEVSRASRGHDEEHAQLLREVQRAEFMALGTHLLGA